MTDEQIIYLSPEEELTTVRERLEHARARRIVLVIPQQTQLRSHVGWRVLHARARELGKDVLVISSDRQVRAVAKAAGFKVADSQESPASSKSGAGSHPSRSDIGSRVPRSRNQPGRGVVENRPPRQRERPPRQQRPREDERETERADETITGASTRRASSTFGIEEERYGPPYDFRIETSPPSPARDEDEEIDHLAADSQIAQSIRDAVRGAEQGTTQPQGAHEPASGFSEPRSSVPSPNEMVEDLFPSEEIEPASLPEQRASAFVEDIDTGVPDISDVPTEVQDVQIEDLGDQGDFLRREESLRQWPDLVKEAPEKQEPPRVHGARPRSSRSGSLIRPPAPNFGEDDELAPIPDQPTLIPSSPSQRQPEAPAAARAGTREPQPMIQPQARNAANRAAAQAAPPPATQTRANRSLVPQTAARATRRAGNNRAAIIVFLSLLLIFVIAAGLLYFGTTATVTITVPSSPLNKTLSFTATTNQQDKAHNTVASQLLSFDASVTGPGTATGTTKQGNSTATGTAIFTNRGSQALDIPTGTSLSTGAGAGSVEFTTTANAVVPAAGSSDPNPPVPIAAKNPGASGNVPANSITVITPDGLTAIAQANNIPSTSVNLSVTNPNPTSGGGAANAPTVTQHDLDMLKASLHKQIQAKLNDWLKQQQNQGNIAGKFIPDVLGSSQPLQQEQLTGTPPVNQPLASSTFTGSLILHVNVLVVRAADLQAAVHSQLNMIAQTMRPASMLAPGVPVKTKVNNSTPSKDGTSLSISVTAAGQIIPTISTQDISRLLAGKTVDQAKSELMNGDAGVQVLAAPNIVVSPSFLSFMPFRPEQIHIVVHPAPIPTKGGASG